MPLRLPEVIEQIRVFRIGSLGRYHLRLDPLELFGGLLRVRAGRLQSLACILGPRVTGSQAGLRGDAAIRGVCQTGLGSGDVFFQSGRGKLDGFGAALPALLLFLRFGSGQRDHEGHGQSA